MSSVRGLWNRFNESDLARLVCINAWWLKIIALVAMTFDHIAMYLFEAPIVSSYETTLHIIGRIAAPIFLFMVAEGARHTQSRVKYILRLFLGNAVCLLLLVFMNSQFNSYIGFHLVGDIFPTMMYTVIIIHCVEKCIRSWREEKHLHSFLVAATLIAVCVIPAILYEVLLNNQAVSAFGDMGPGATLGMQLIKVFFPSILSVEYTPLFIILGLLFYWLPNKSLKVVSLVAFAILARFPMGLDTGYFISYFGINQHYMFLAIPFICLYNGKKGFSGKYFFYVYYIVHPYIILLIGYLCGMRFMGS
ncbi:MAG: conjugal transfer protein TraX [Coriobacteriales bacterium]|jgi:hypothetical protein|nr:conjugal transfer protein TraX [Coriobacteriales bacterium]